MIHLLHDEIALIKKPEIQNFTLFVLSYAPEYFWIAPSSSSGKYHPPQSNGEGGLVRHTKAVVYFAVALCRSFACTEDEQDCIISACILHDIMKYGHWDTGHTVKLHPKMAAQFIHEKSKIFNIDPIYALMIDEAVFWHMGRWTPQESKTFPDYFERHEIIVHLADMMAAQSNVSLLHINAPG